MISKDFGTVRMKNGEGIKKDCPKLKGKCYQSGSDSNKKEQIDLIGN